MRHLVFFTLVCLLTIPFNGISQNQMELSKEVSNFLASQKGTSTQNALSQIPQNGVNYIKNGLELAIAEANHPQRCHTTEVHEEAYNSNSQYRTRYDQKKIQIDQIRELSRSSSMLNCTSPIIIPVAVHYEGISTQSAACLESLALSQIAVLNDDFAAANADLANFCDDVDASGGTLDPNALAFGGSCIIFCLADQNHPGGFGLNNGDYAITINENYVANAPGFPNFTGGIWSGYLNIFVTEGTGVLGYAPLGGSANGDGVVIEACVFGSQGFGCGGGVGPGSGCNGYTVYNLGRTTTHEVGHYLTLDHIWSAAGCANDDGVGDTPVADDEYYGCPTIGGASTSCGSQDMYMNYMDYTNDACMYMFSEGQATNMYNYANTLGWGINKCASPPSYPAQTLPGGCNNCTITLSVSGTDQTCAMAGTATATPAGGTSPYTYTWSNGGNTQTINGLVAGTYSVTVVDNAGCSGVDNVMVSNTCTAICDTIGNYNLVTDNPVNYASDNSGYVSGHNGYGDIGKADYFNYNGIHTVVKGAYMGFGTASASNATSTFDVVMRDGTAGTPGAILASVPVTYDEIVTLIGGGSNVTFIEFPTPVTLPASQDFFMGIEFAYNALDTISLITNTDPETSPATAWEQWSDGNWFTYDDASSWGLSVAHYIFPVLGTSPSGSFTPTAPVECVDTPITFTGTGTDIEQYDWLFPGGTPATASGASVNVSYPIAGSYDVSFIMVNGCISDTTTIANAITINPCGGCTLTATAAVNSDASCNGVCDGSATATPVAGTAPFTYAWTSTETSQTANLLCAGTNTVTITDADGCTAIANVTITEPTAVGGTLSSTAESCTGADGTATVAPTGGSGSYTYLWDAAAGSQTVATAVGLTAGTYGVTVTDSNGCEADGSISVANGCSIGCDTISNFLPAYVPTIYLSDNSGYLSGNNGYGDLAKSDYYNYAGTNTHVVGGYIYFENIAISNPATSSLQAAIWDGTGGTPGAILGTKTILLQDIQDELDLGNIYYVTFDNPIPLTTNEFFMGAILPTTTGDTAVIVTNTIDDQAAGTGSAWELWSDGTTSVNYNDATSWGVDLTHYIIPVLGVDPTAGFTPASQTVCADDAAIFTNTSTNATTYEWQFPGGTPATSTSSNPGAIVYAIPGSYDVTLIATNDCVSDTLTVMNAVTVTQTIVSTTSTDVLCSTTCDGTGTATATSGNAPYTYQWDAGAGNQTTPTANGLCVGSYGVTVTDANGCTASGSVTINGPTNLASSTSATQESCAGNDGTATVTASGGTAPYTYLWDAAAGSQTTATAINLTVGTYMVTVTDANGCTINDMASVTNGCTCNLAAAILVDNNVSCNGICDGQATVSHAGEVLPVTYLWDAATGSQTTATAIGLCAGTYSVTVTDGNGCTVTEITTVTEPVNLTSTTTSMPESCAGNDGTATVSESGGTGPYTYQWDAAAGNQTTATAINLSANSYSVTVTDANGCTSVNSATVTDGCLCNIVATTTVNNNVTCNGFCDGEATVIQTGGTMPVTYLWDAAAGSQTTATAIGLCAGTYNVTVTGADGCTAQAIATITEPLAMTINTNAGNETCNGDCTGTVGANASGGTAPYTYMWNEGTMNASVNGLCAGTYTVTVTDANGCTNTASAVVGAGTLVTATTSSTQESCAGNDGTATATGTGGLAPYTYLWDATAGSQTVATAVGLAAGSYSVTVTDLNGCSATTSVTVTNGCVCSLVAQANTDSNVSCNGICDGIATASSTGGTAPFTYQWDANAGNQTTATAVGLCAGVYNVTVTDTNGCTDAVGVTITEPTLLVASATSVSETCAGDCNGTATATATGGTAPYSYTWNTAGTTSTETGLCAGTYTITVTDANGCIATAMTMVGAGSTILVAGTSTPEGCTGNDATATAAPTGGSMPYSYQWDAGAGNQTTATASGLTVGTYSVTATDANGCVGTTTVSISNGCGCSIVATTNVDSNVSCNGVCDGVATASQTGGTMPVSFLWDAGAGNQTTATAIGLCAGVYNVTATDVNGCESITSVTINEPTALTANASSTGETCAGDCTGTATVTASGGTAPYVYLWDNGNTTGSINALCAGTYSVTIVDANACITTTSVLVNSGATVSSSATSTSTSCAGNDGTATVTASGGSGTYTYLWDAASGSQTTATATGLGTGSYAVTVTDSDGCTANAATTVNDGCVCSVTASATTDNNVSCNGICDGSATVTSTGGTAPISYLWDAATGNQTTATAIGLCAGTYNVTVTDTDGCFDVTTVTITEPATLVATTNTTGESCAGNDGTATVNATGGTSPYAYQWDAAAGSQTTATAIGLTAGTYAVTITDGNGCTTMTMATVNNVCVCTLTATTTVDNNVSCNGICDGQATAVEAGGTAPYTYQWDAGTGNQTTATAIGLCAGTYNVTISDSNGCTAVANVTITEPLALVATGGSTGESCAGNDGTATATATGGTMPYAYQWDAATGNQTNATAIGLTAGTYSVTISDANGCTTTTTATVNNVCVCTLTATTTVDNNVSCNGICDGQATAIEAGGTAPYTYQWDAGTGSQTTATAVGLCAGTYNVTISDVNGCTAIANVSISEPSALATATASTDESCGDGTGTATVTIVGGTAPYSYQWDAATGNQTTATAVGLNAGTYSVTVLDANACMTMTSVQVADFCPCNGVLTLSSTNATCGSGGTASATVVGGTTPYSYNWDTGGTTQTIAGLTPGSFAVTVTDANGCETNGSVTVGDSGTLNATVTTTNVTCGGDANGSATVDNAGLTYLWNTTATTQTISGLTAGTYSVTVSSGTCIDIETVTITGPAPLNVNIIANDNLCSVDAASASAVPTGGTAPYTYLWDTGAMTQTIAGLGTGSYTVTVTDANGCSSQNTTSITSIASGPVLSTTQTNISCNGMMDGSIDLTVSSGTAPFTYDWGSGITTEDVNGLPAGVYTVVVSDANGCIAVTTVVISAPTAITVFTSSTAANNNDGTATAVVTGGTPAYTYLWSDGQTTQTATGLAQGTYTVTVTDTNGCTEEGTIVVPLGTSTFDIESLTSFEIYPNPNDGRFNVAIEYAKYEEAQISIYNVLGQEVFNRDASGVSLGFPVDISDKAAGSYFIVLKTAQGHAVKQFTLIE